MIIIIREKSVQVVHLPIFSNKLFFIRVSGVRVAETLVTDKFDVIWEREKMFFKRHCLCRRQVFWLFFCSLELKKLLREGLKKSCIEVQFSITFWPGKFKIHLNKGNFYFVPFLHGILPFLNFWSRFIRFLVAPIWFLAPPIQRATPIWLLTTPIKALC